ncbi:hypothetical protein GCM10009608_25600 [Pseudonocardia alaniniphila]
MHSCVLSSNDGTSTTRAVPEVGIACPVEPEEPTGLARTTTVRQDPSSATVTSAVEPIQLPATSGKQLA